MTKTRLPSHCRLEQVEAEAGCIKIGGKPLTQIAESVGTTPFFVYDGQSMTERVQTLRNTLPKAVHLHYAVKANPMPPVIQHMLSLVDGLDVASAGEMRTALSCGASADLISFAGPGKTPQELKEAVAAGITINIESEREMEIIASAGQKTGAKPAVAVRVNPDFELKTSGMKMSGGPKQFGIDAERVPDAIRRLHDLDLDFRGLHIFSGSQNLRPEAICEAQSKSIELAEKLAEHSKTPIKVLNIGGGFGIPYFPGDEPLDLAPIADNLENLIARAAQSLPDAQIVLELGRYLVGESGYYVCEVIDRKISRGHVFLVTNGGLHHHLAASGNFGQVIRKNYPVLVGNKVNGATRETVSVVGPLCTPLDLLADKMEMTKADVGDLIVVMQSGAYGLTASPTAFLSHPAPKEIFI